MNRRSFLTALSLSPVVAVLPALAVEPVATKAMVPLKVTVDTTQVQAMMQQLQKRWSDMLPGMIADMQSRHGA